MVDLIVMKSKEYDFIARNKRDISYSLFILVIFVALGVLGQLNELDAILKIIIEKKPLPGYYFPIYLLIGLCIPVLLRFSRIKRIYREYLIDPYLILLFFQILTELILVCLIGKGIAVIVGFVFSLARLIQIGKLLNLSKAFNYMSFFLYIQFVLWTLNIVNIIFSRLLNIVDIIFK